MRSLTRAALALSLGVAVLVPTSGGAVAGTATEPAVPGQPTDAVTAWNASAGDAALLACLAPADNPLHESHLYAMMHIAIHDALNAISRRSRPYAYFGHAQAGASPVAAVASAARNTLVPVLRQLPAPIPQECIDKGVASVEADYTAALRAVPAGPAKWHGMSVGRAAAHAIVAKRADDGTHTVVLVDDAYAQGKRPGVWRFTPDRPFAFAPGWAKVTPFVLESAAQFRPGPPNAVTSQAYAADVNEIKRLGGDDVTTPSERNAEQTQIARFWLESSPLAWNRIGRTVSRSQHLDLWENARLFGLLNMALADGYVGSWETKYHYRYWRPVTAIREAATDGNPMTTADPTWTPLATTPPIPDYDSAHAVEGAAAAAVFRGFFGTDRIAFSACSRLLPAGQTCTDSSPVLRQFRSFSHAARENGLSRIYIGFHFRNAVEVGVEHGRQIGRRTVDDVLRPVAGG